MTLPRYKPDENQRLCQAVFHWEALFFLLQNDNLWKYYSGATIQHQVNLGKSPGGKVFLVKRPFHKWDFLWEKEHEVTSCITGSVLWDRWLTLSKETPTGRGRHRWTSSWASRHSIYIHVQLFMFFSAPAVYQVMGLHWKSSDDEGRPRCGPKEFMVH